jgi:hypothetical protein
MSPKAKAQAGLSLMKQAILDLLSQHPDGLTNSQIATDLDIHSDFLGQQRDYLSWSIVGLLVNENMVEKSQRIYRLKTSLTVPADSDPESTV